MVGRAASSGTRWTEDADSLRAGGGVGVSGEDKGGSLGLSEGGVEAVESEEMTCAEPAKEHQSAA